MRLSLVLPLRNGKLLLGYKKRGFGAGKWNGFGGKLVKGESPEDCGKRELLEESGLAAHKLELSAANTFIYPDQRMRVYIFSCGRFTGTPLETQEMRPRWFALSRIPYRQMWDDDRYWLPLLLNNKKFEGKFWFDVKLRVFKYEIKFTEKL